MAAAAGETKMQNAVLTDTQFTSTVVHTSLSNCCLKLWYLGVVESRREPDFGSVSPGIPPQHPQAAPAPPPTPPAAGGVGVVSQEVLSQNPV